MNRTVDQVLAALRSLADPQTARQGPYPGTVIANIPAPTGTSPRLNRQVAERTHCTPGTVDHYLALLAWMGMLQDGEGRPRASRWVVMNGEARQLVERSLARGARDGSKINMVLNVLRELADPRTSSASSGRSVATISLRGNVGLRTLVHGRLPQFDLRSIDAILAELGRTGWLKPGKRGGLPEKRWVVMEGSYPQR